MQLGVAGDCWLLLGCHVCVKTLFNTFFNQCRAPSILCVECIWNNRIPINSYRNFTPKWDLACSTLSKMEKLG